MVALRQRLYFKCDITVRGLTAVFSTRDASAGGMMLATAGFVMRANRGQQQQQ
jgi:hypothetical protein